MTPGLRPVTPSVSLRVVAFSQARPDGLINCECRCHRGMTPISAIRGVGISHVGACRPTDVAGASW